MLFSVAVQASCFGLIFLIEHLYTARVYITQSDLTLLIDLPVSVFPNAGDTEVVRPSKQCY